MRIGVNLDTNSLKEPRLLKRAPTAQDSVPHDRVVLAQEAGSERFSERLLFQKAKGAESEVGAVLSFPMEQKVPPHPPPLCLRRGTMPYLRAR